MFTGTAVGTSAGAQLKFASVEVLLELLPFLICRFAVLLRGPGRTPMLQVTAIGADQVFLEDG